VCYFGTDVDKKEALIANKMTKEEIEKEIGADSLEYLSMDSLKEIAKGCKINDYCYVWCKGTYQIEVPETIETDGLETITYEKKIVKDKQNEKKINRKRNRSRLIRISKYG